MAKETILPQVTFKGCSASGCKTGFKVGEGVNAKFISSQAFNCETGFDISTQNNNRVGNLLESAASGYLSGALLKASGLG